MSLFKQALNLPYTRWWDIKPLLESAKDNHDKEVLRRLMEVKRNRLEKDGNKVRTA